MMISVGPAAGSYDQGLRSCSLRSVKRRVGAVLSIEASRLARNGRDWHTLLEFCGLVGTLIVDEDGIYDPRMPNDRLLLGMKGTMSEMEVSVFRQRSMEAMKQKAKRGELFLTVAVGYVKTDDNRIEKAPDRRVREAIELVFPSLLSCKPFAKYSSGCGKNRSCYQPSSKERVSGRSNGRHPSTTRCIIC